MPAIICALLSLVLALPAIAVPPDLVTTAGTEFAKDGRAYRFIGVNLRGLVHYGGGDGALPYTRLEHIDENLAGARDMGCRVARVFAANRNISHEDAVARLGHALDRAHAHGIKLIVALTDFYPTPFHPQGDDAYYTENPWGWTVLNDEWFAGGYEDNYLPYVTLAVDAHKDHPAVFSWQLGNELADQTNPANFAPFVHAVAAHIRLIDPYHMVSIGMLSIDHNPLSVSQAIELYGDDNLHFITIHSYNGETRPRDYAVRDAVGKPILVSEAGCDEASAGGDRVSFMDNLVNQFVHTQGARGFMHWGYQAQAYDIGDGDNTFGFDRYAHGDYDAMYAMYQAHAAVLNAYDEPVGDAPGPRGRNLALTAAAWDADSIFSGEYAGDKAYDGSLSTKWTSTEATSVHWLALDLGGDYIITGYTVQMASAGGEWTDFNFTHYELQTGDSLSGPWITAFDVPNPGQLGSITSAYDTPVRARFVRVEVDDCGIDDYARLPEFEVIGDPPPRADLDGDDDVDLADFATVQLCFRGSGVPHPGLIGDVDCAAANLDIGPDDPPDGDVDLADLTALLTCLTGPATPPPLDCY